MRRMLLAAMAAATVPGFALAQQGAASTSKPIVAFVAHWQAAYNHHDPAGVTALYTPDGVIVSPYGIMRGPAAIEKYIATDLKLGWHDIVIHDDGDQVHGNTAYAVGDWSGRVPGPKGADVPVAGYWSGVMVRSGGAWKLETHTINLKLPIPGQK
ncbi:MAG: YybH family protein [Trebonia sp.]